jgi:hypothetical protein
MTETYKNIAGETGKLAKRESFEGSSLRAAWTTMRPASGRLSEAEFQTLRLDWLDAIDASLPMYVVYSYDTPIAWAMKGKNAYCTTEKFSKTTSKGQSVVRQWIDHSN